ncbi:MAG: DUF1700 domain-containing protein [Lachnospiraceae bacterium]|nr:DUF1700 domain-containing protein [Lachnospiraceae bacterium]
MTKQEFAQALRGKLAGIPQADIEERISYCCERIDGRVQDGLSEEAAVAEIGPVDLVAEQMMSEIPLSTLVRQKVAPTRRHGAARIVLLIIGFPIWFPLLVAALAVAFSFYIAFWAVAIALYAADLGLLIGVIAALFAAGMQFATGNPAGGGFFAGAALILAGLMILLFIVCMAFSGGLVRLLGAAVMGIKKLFVGKEPEIVDNGRKGASNEA